jgi:hypothetical protein
MRKLFLLFISIVLAVELANAQYNPTSNIENHIISFITLQQGKSFNQNSAYNILIKEHSKVLEFDIYKFSLINLFEVKQDILSDILFNNKLQNDTILMDKLERCSTADKILLIDSLLFKYLLTKNTDTILNIYKRKFGSDKIIQNKCIAWKIAIVAYSASSDQYYMLLGFRNNDFKSFYFTELLTKLNIKSYNKRAIKNKLRRLNNEHFDLVDLYEYYIEKDGCEERYPIRYYLTFQ